MIMTRENKILPLRHNLGFPFGMGIDPYGNPMPYSYANPVRSDCSVETYRGVDKDGKEWIRWEYIDTSL